MKVFGNSICLKLEIHRALEFNQLSGELPLELGNLPQLERL